MKAKHLTAGVSTFALLASMSATQAAQISINLDGSFYVPSADAFIANTIDLGENLGNSGTVTAAANGNTVAFTDEATGQGTDPSVVMVDNTLIGAFATGNNFDAAVDVDLINDSTEATDPGASGIGIITFALNTGVVSASTRQNEISVEETDLTPGSTLSNSQNLITAQTTLNRGTTEAAGAVPNGYTDDTGGAIEFESDIGSPAPLSSDATIATGSVQQNTGDASSSFARAGGNTIDLTVTPTNGSEDNVDGSLGLSDNEVSSNFIGNSARSSVEIEAGDSPSFAGSIAVSNVQANQDLGDDGQPATSTNIATTIAASVGGTSPTDGTSTLVSTLDVSGNLITAYATGNASLANDDDDSVGNQITIDDTMSVDVVSDGNSTSAETENGEATGSVEAGLALFSFQANDQDEDGISSLVQNATVSALVQNMDGASLGVSGNDVIAQARGNTVSNSILAPGLDGNSASFAGSAGLLNVQTNYESDLDARVANTDILAQAGNATDTTEDSAVASSTIEMAGNNVVANAIANQAGNSIGIGGASVALDGDDFGLSGGNQIDGEVSSTAGVTLTNFQSDYINGVSASNESTTLLLDASDLTGDVTNSTLSIVGNSGTSEIDAVAASASANNLIGIDGTNIAGSVGLNNLQVQDGDDATTASVSDPLVQILVDTVDSALDGDATLTSSIAITDMTVRALAYGATAGNFVEIDADAGTSFADAAVSEASLVTFDLDEGEGNFFDADTANLPTVVANYALLSNQNREGSVSADVTANDAPFQIVIGNTSSDPSVGDADRTSVQNDGNSLLATAFGNQVTNDMALDLAEVGDAQDGDDNVANVTNVQTLGADAEITASVDTAGAGISTEIAYTAENSSVSLSDNLTQAEAFGNRASSGAADAVGNRLVVDAVTLDLTGADRDGLAMETGPTGAFEANAAFTVQNVQSGAAVVSATLGANQNAGTSLTVGGDVINSSLAQDGNQFIANAFNNQAINDLILTANTVATTTGVQNFQVTSSTVEASTGEPGEPGSIEEVPAPVNLNAVASAASKSILTSIGGNSGDITTSSVSVDRNLDLATAVANDAVNSLSVDAGSLDPASDPAQALAELDLADQRLQADADHAVTNYQLLQNGGSTSAQAAVELGITVDTVDLASGEAEIEGSSLSVSGNQQQALAVGNRATSMLDLAGTNSGNLGSIPSEGVSSALASLQDVGADETLTATSWMDVSAPASMIDSSLELSDNVSSALATFNQSINTIDVTATNVASAADTPTSGNAVWNSTDEATTALADNALNNVQSVGEASSVDAQASLNLYNQELGTGTVTGINGSSIVLNGNQANAQAISNASENTLNLTALSNIAATGAVTSNQDNAASVDARTFGSVSLALEGAGVDTMTGSSAALDNNQFTATARGNQVLNALNVDVGANYGDFASGASATSSATGPSNNIASGSYAVLNRQTNSGPVSATVTGRTQATLGGGVGGATGGTQVGSTLSISGNSYEASAYGNQAQNTISSSVRPGGSAPMALSNVQTNSGSVTATASNVVIGVSVSANGGPTSGSTNQIGNNRVSATASGNSVTSRISSRN